LKKGHQPGQQHPRQLIICMEGWFRMVSLRSNRHRTALSEDRGYSAYRLESDQSNTPAPPKTSCGRESSSPPSLRARQINKGFEICAWGLCLASTGLGRTWRFIYTFFFFSSILEQRTAKLRFACYIYLKIAFYFISASETSWWETMYWLSINERVRTGLIKYIRS